MTPHASLVPAALVRRALFAIAAASLTAAAACSDSTGVGPSTGSQLAFTTGGSSASLAAVPITKDGHTLDLTAVTVVVARASLKQAQTDVCGADDDDMDANHNDGVGDRRHDEHCGEVKIGPAIVDLPLDGKLVTLPANTIPPGTYRELDVRVSMVRLQGTFDSKPFDVTVPVNAKSEIDFETPIAVAADSAISVTVNLPVDTWLVRQDGTLVDPNTLLTNPVAMAAVRFKIASSIHAFEDRDHDGRDDHRHRD